MGFTLNQLEQERQIRKLQKKEDKDTSNYEQLSNLPKINNVELKGDKTTSDLGINADNVMMSDDVTSVEEAVGNLLNGAVFEPFQAPGANPFTEGGSGYILKVKYNNTLLGYFVIRPKGHSDTSGKKVALELYDANWGQAWEVYRDYPA